MGPSPRLEEAAEQYNTWNYYNKKRRLRGAAIVEVAAAPARARGQLAKEGLVFPIIFSLEGPVHWPFPSFANSMTASDSFLRALLLLYVLSQAANPALKKTESSAAVWAGLSTSSEYKAEQAARTILRIVIMTLGNRTCMMQCICRLQCRFCIAVLKDEKPDKRLDSQHDINSGDFPKRLAVKGRLRMTGNSGDPPGEAIDS
ncbi:hypothetical protein PC120_g14239 [Phytophthora cactorum]|nr:hypothetical protein PC120_g14239 [Phytophthora cactorum]